MKINVIGAAGGEVTGSAYYIRTRQTAILIDCGMFQGGKKSESLSRPPASATQKLDAVLLTHGHLDHTGRLPLLIHRGHHMPIYGTPATLDMVGLILRDAARIQASDIPQKKSKADAGGSTAARATFYRSRRAGSDRLLQAGSLQQTVPRSGG
jgi:metallo-beta-lactamase family protein